MSLIMLLTLIVLGILTILSLLLADFIGELVIKVFEFITYKGEDKNE